MTPIQLSASDMEILNRSVDLIYNKLAESNTLAGDLEQRIIDYSLNHRACTVCASNCDSACYSGCVGDCAGNCKDSCKAGCKSTCHTSYWSSG